MKRLTSESIDGGSVTNLIWDKYSGANKTVQTATELIYVTSTEPKEVGLYETLHVYNNSTDTAWVYFKDSLTDNANLEQKSLPLAPKSWFLCNNSNHTFVNSSGVNVYIYRAKSDSKAVQG